MGASPSSPLLHINTLTTSLLSLSFFRSLYGGNTQFLTPLTFGLSFHWIQTPPPQTTSISFTISLIIPISIYLPSFTQQHFPPQPTNPPKENILPLLRYWVAHLFNGAWWRTQKIVVYTTQCT